MNDFIADKETVVRLERFERDGQLSNFVSKNDRIFFERGGHFPSKFPWPKNWTPLRWFWNRTGFDKEDSQKDTLETRSISGNKFQKVGRKKGDRRKFFHAGNKTLMLYSRTAFEQFISVPDMTHGEISYPREDVLLFTIPSNKYGRIISKLIKYVSR